MSAATETLFEEAMRLPVETRQELARRILEASPPDGEFISNTMTAVRSRMERVASGASALVPAADAHRDVREFLGSHAPD